MALKLALWNDHLLIELNTCMEILAQEQGFKCMLHTFKAWTQFKKVWNKNNILSVTLQCKSFYAILLFNHDFTSCL